MNIFGNDGFRCEFGKKFMTNEFITKFAHSVTEVIDNDKPVLIARDTRDSGKIIESWIAEVLISKGFNIHIAEVLPTPGISHMLGLGSYSLGIMITASHNPHTDNGIKLFGKDGYKLNPETESLIEEIILKENFYTKASNNGEKIVLQDAFKNYINSISAEYSKITCDKRVLVDCSNGAYSELNNMNRFENISFVNCEPDGSNINLDCGALHPENLLKQVVNENYDFGICFDGDGDRAVFMSKEYGMIESEKLAAMFFEISNKRNLKVVSSEISNFALKSNLKSLGAHLIETPVGDRFIVDYVNNQNALFGFEPSGHFHFPDKTKSMDGYISLIKFLELISIYGNEINKKLSMLNHFQRVQENIDIRDLVDINLSYMQNKITTHIDNKNERLVIRESMWDPVIRVYYDYIKENNYSFIKENINKIIEDQK